jgi:pyruvate/2-oxoglutarate dehydrogenase complex dihydrolipoamide acyltransferase (E2) component
MNIDLGEKQHLTSYRKVAIASWRHPRDPTTYAMLDLPVDAAMAFLKTSDSETPATLTHYVTKIAAHCLDKHPNLNHVLRLGNLYARKQVDIFITTVLMSGKGMDLSGFVIRNVNKKSVTQIASISQSRAEDLRQNVDENHLEAQRVVNPLPTLLLIPLLLIQEFLQFTLNVSIPFLGMPKDRFGSAIVTNIGALGLENAFIPLSPYSRCPVLIGIGKPRKIPVVRDDKVIVVNSVIITFTIDHRYADGSHGARLLRRFKKVFANPSAYRSVFDGEPPTPGTRDDGPTRSP